MQIINARPVVEILITGMMSDGSDRQETTVNMFEVTVHYDGANYSGRITNLEEETIMEALNTGILAVGKQSVEDALETLREENEGLKSDNLTNKRAIFDLFAENEQLEADAAVTLLELVDTQTRLRQSEADHAALLFELVDKGGI